MTMRYLAPALALALLPLGGAQAQSEERINQVIVYGDDPCPTSTDDEIVVCARKPDGDRYRIPEPLRGTSPNAPSNDAWANRAQQLEIAGRTGIGSCTPAEGGGVIGCFNQLVRQAREERAAGDATNWGALVEAARQERLGRIDAESAEIDRRITEEEKARAEREAQMAKAAAELAAKEAAEKQKTPE